MLKYIVYILRWMGYISISFSIIEFVYMIFGPNTEVFDYTLYIGIAGMWFLVIADIVNRHTNT